MLKFSYKIAVAGAAIFVTLGGASAASAAVLHPNGKVTDTPCNIDAGTWNPGSGWTTLPRNYRCIKGTEPVDVNEETAEEGEVTMKNSPTPPTNHNTTRTSKTVLNPGGPDTSGDTVQPQAKSETSPR